MKSPNRTPLVFNSPHWIDSPIKCIHIDYSQLYGTCSYWPTYWRNRNKHANISPACLALCITDVIVSKNGALSKERLQVSHYERYLVRTDCYSAPTWNLTPSPCITSFSHASRLVNFWPPVLRQSPVIAVQSDWRANLWCPCQSRKQVLIAINKQENENSPN